MRLTILIPTFNRCSRVVPLVRYLTAHIPLDLVEAVEILVVDNCSSDNTSEELRQIRSPLLRVHRRAQFAATSEENVITSVAHCKGEFVWTLGDDDIPHLHCLLPLIQLLDADAPDMLVFNFKVMDGDGILRSYAQVRGAPAEIDIPLLDLVKRNGLVNCLSGFSSLITRRALLDVDAGRALMRVSRIYAHCFWYLQCFRDKRVRFINRPLITYRIFHAAGWEKWARDNHCGVWYPWHLGLLRLYEQAMQMGLLAPRDIAEIYEYRHDGTKYRAIEEIVGKLYEQACTYMASRDARELLTRDEFSYAKTLLVQVDLSLADVLNALQDLYEQLWSKWWFRRSARAARKRYFRLMAARGLYDPLHQEWYGDFHIYLCGSQYVAIHNACNVDALLSSFDQKDSPPHVLVGTTIEEARDLIDAAQRAVRLQEFRPANPSRAAELQQELDAIRASKSWRVTAPLRKVAQLGRSLLRAHS